MKMCNRYNSNLNSPIDFAQFKIQRLSRYILKSSRQCIGFYFIVLIIHCNITIYNNKNLRCDAFCPKS